jgi:hypothetical protein
MTLKETPVRYAVQALSAVVMIRPHPFESNPETQADNAFQKSSDAADRAIVAKQAFEEVTQTAQSLVQAGVRMHLFEDDDQQKNARFGLSEQLVFYACRWAPCAVPHVFAQPPPRTAS